MRMFLIAATLVAMAPPAAAQDAGLPPPLTTQQRLEAMIGAMAVQNAELSNRVDVLTRQLEAAKKEAAKETPPAPDSWKGK